MTLASARGRHEWMSHDAEAQDSEAASAQSDIAGGRG